MAKNEPEYFPCTGCSQTLTDENAFLDVEKGDAPYCEACFYKFPAGPFFGAYDRKYCRDHPTEKQQYCVSCQRCCGKCYYLDRAEGCTIYPYRPLYCRGYECKELRDRFSD